MSANPKGWQDTLLHYERWLSEQPLSTVSKRVYLSNVRGLIRFAQSHCPPDAELDYAGLANVTASYLAERRAISAEAANWSLPALNSLCRCLGFAPLKGLRSEDRRESQIYYLCDQDHDVYRSEVLRITNLRNKLAILLILDAGVRPSELVRLKQADFDWHALVGTIHVDGRTSRTIGLPPSLSTQIYDLISQCLLKGPNFPLFQTRTGKPMDTQSIDMLIRSVGIKKGLVVSASVLRATFLMNARGIEESQETAMNYRQSRMHQLQSQMQDHSQNLH